MRKVLIISVLLVLFAIPAGAQMDEEAKRAERRKATALLLQTFGWKCDKILPDKVDTAGFEHGELRRIHKLECEDGLVYYEKVYVLKNKKLLVEYCHKGTCKEFK